MVMGRNVQGSGLGKEGFGSPDTRPLPFPDEADQRQYEEWLFHTQQLLQMQLKVLEEQIGVHRKSRKALCAKQRTAKKAGREFPEADAEKLKLVPINTYGFLLTFIGSSLPLFLPLPILFPFADAKSMALPRLLTQLQQLRQSRPYDKSVMISVQKLFSSDQI